MSSVLPLALLAIHAHPDDETITMGGTLARYSAAGVRTVAQCKHMRPCSEPLMRSTGALTNAIATKQAFPQ